jgi:membrane-bound metal-dependent hydrolase YbcI (DUF457 family)
MPFTPFHLGPGLLVGLLLLRYVDFPTFLMASVIVDVEPFLVLWWSLPYPLHGFFHSFLGGTLVALVLTVVMRKVRKSLSPVLLFFQINQAVSFKKIVLASVSGIYLHILLDSLMHSDIRPFYPFDLNPFLGMTSVVGVYMLCVWSVMGGVVIYILKIVLSRRKGET